VRGERDLVAGARVVEARRDVDGEVHLPAHGEHAADQAMALRRHEVMHLPDSVSHQEPRHEDVSIGQVELLRAPAVPFGGDSEAAPAVGVEDGPEHARRVEAGAAVPVDRAVGADERDRVQVADQAVLRDRQVTRAAHGTSASLPLSAELSSSS
jgi:hypothetical protein